MTFSACSIFEQDKDAISNGEENITFADLSQVPCSQRISSAEKLD
jgi:hypothetical protein